MSEEEMARAEEIRKAATMQLSGLYSRRHAAEKAIGVIMDHRNELVSMIQSVKASMDYIEIWEVRAKEQDCDGMKMPEGLLSLLKAQLLELEQEWGKAAERLDAASREASQLRIEEMQTSVVLTAVNLLRSAELMLG